MLWHARLVGDHCLYEIIKVDIVKTDCPEYATGGSDEFEFFEFSNSLNSLNFLNYWSRGLQGGCSHGFGKEIHRKALA